MRLHRAELEAVGRLVARIADDVVMSRFRRLADGDVRQKAAGDLVTVADLLVESRLSEELTRLVPGSVAVGEEAVAREPSVLGALRGDAPAWIIDPVDGTAAFAAGRARFSTMVALSAGGEIVASWIYFPPQRTLACALAGDEGGAFVDGRRVSVAARPGRHRPRVITTDPNYHSPTDRLAIARLEALGCEVLACDGVGYAYLDLVVGAAEATMFSWDNPWDHAPGLFLYEMAGGHSTTADGRPFRVTGGNALPLLAAHDQPTLTWLRGLFGPRS
jgi:fructose-1,6-bisphosphatase/inositol monophosphatase family enzyme